MGELIDPLAMMPTRFDIQKNNNLTRCGALEARLWRPVPVVYHYRRSTKFTHFSINLIRDFIQ
ncbi:hypothetical protein HMPREF0005_02865 [Achromobacter xylosoxidans C54]|nr:hypothetical protein HMPREF0005_02865 [Achromobacter xylosoxidans C54]